MQASRGSRGGPRAVAFYDLDGTLAKLNLINAAVYLLTNLGEWSGRLRYLAGFVGRIPALYRAEQRDRFLLNVVLFDVFKGISRDRLITLGEEYCDRVLMRHAAEGLAILQQPVEIAVTGAGDACGMQGRAATPAIAIGAVALRAVVLIQVRASSDGIRLAADGIHDGVVCSRNLFEPRAIGGSHQQGRRG